MGYPSKYDDHYFAILDDVFGGRVQVVEFKAEFFDCTAKVNVPVNGEAALKMWEDDLEATLVTPPKHNKETIRVTKMMYVPTQFIGLFIGQRFTPRQLMEDIYPIVVADGILEDLKPLVQWMMACGMAIGTEGVTSPVLLPDIIAPVMDATFFEWIKQFLDRTIPDRNGEGQKSLVETTEHQVASVVAQVLQEQQLSGNNQTTSSRKSQPN
jgi:hypothetical protein